MNPGWPVGEALLTAGARIEAVGDKRGLEALVDSDTLRFDLRGRTVIPGLIDSHTHLFSYAMGKEWLDLKGAESFRKISSDILAGSGPGEEGRWILGRGWDENSMRDGEYPGIAFFDQASRGRPMYLERICSHAAVVNSEALKLAGLDRTGSGPEGGIVSRDESGKPTGMIFDRALDSVRSLLPSPGPSMVRELLEEAAGDCMEAGLTGVCEMGLGMEELNACADTIERGFFPVRLAAYLVSEGGTGMFVEAREKFDDLKDNLKIAGMKFFSDGSVGAGTAAMLEDYTDEPGNRGLLVENPEILAGKLLDCHTKGVQTAVHSIGDRSARILLDIFEKTGFEGEWPRHRIEHAQIIDRSDVKRFGRLGLIPSMQFIHCVSDYPWVVERIGGRRAEDSYSWKSLLSSSGVIAAGSDMPIEPMNPFWGIHAAVTRRNIEGKPPEGWHPEQRLSLREALQAYTAWASYAEGREREVGTLEKGKFADFIVLSDDIFNVPESRIPELKVLATIIGGEVVFSRADSPIH